MEYFLPILFLFVSFFYSSVGLGGGFAIRGRRAVARAARRAVLALVVLDVLGRGGGARTRALDAVGAHEPRGAIGAGCAPRSIHLIHIFFSCGSCTESAEQVTAPRSITSSASNVYIHH